MRCSRRKISSCHLVLSMNVYLPSVEVDTLTLAKTYITYGSNNNTLYCVSNNMLIVQSIITNNIIDSECKRN